MTIRRRRAPLARSTTPIARTRIRSTPQTRRKKQARAVVIATTRVIVFDRDPDCRRCQAPGREDDHLHEVRSRALMRGRPPEEIFATRQTMRLCAACHLTVITPGHEDIVYDDPDAGCNGTVRFVPRPPKPRPWRET